MTVHYDAHGVTLHHGDCLDVLRQLPDNSVDAVVTDPPYGLEFMGKEWDSFAPERTQYHGERADTSKNIGSDDSKPSSRHHVSYSMTRPTFRRCRLCAKREFSGSPCRCDAPEWDYEQPAGTPTRMAAFQKWSEAWAAECLRVLKPGGHLLAFGGTRTWHRLACAIEDAGFEIRDSIAWMYGSGFPKSLDVSKAIDKAAGATREVVGVRWAERYPNGAGGNSFTVGAGPDGTRVGPEPLTAPATPEAARWAGWGTALKPAHEPIVVARKPLAGTVAANVLAHGTGALNIDGCRIGTDEPLGRPTGAGAFGIINDDGWVPTLERTPGNPAGRWPANVVLDESQAAALDAQSGTIVDRNGGMGGWREDYVGGTKNADTDTATYRGEGGASRFYYTAKADADERPRVAGAAHPTVKPIALMRWLVRLVTPPGGVVLEPFAGSGTTAEACLLEGFRCIAVEREADYLPLIVARITRQRDPVAHVQLVGDGDTPTLFDHL